MSHNEVLEIDKEMYELNNILITKDFIKYTNKSWFN